MSYTDAEVDAVLRSIEDALASCTPFSAGAPAIEIVLTPDGRLLRDDSALMSTSAAACLDDVLAATRMPRSARLGRTVSFDSAAVWARADPSVRPAEHVRRALATLASELVACTGGSAGIVITVSWARDGSLGAAVPLAEGSRIEDCVRRLVARLSIPRASSAGVLEYTILR